MSDERDPVRERLVEAYLGKPLGPIGHAPDPVNIPMIRHWVDALDDQNPIYLDPEAAAKTRHGEVVAPPAMLQSWIMPRPKIEGIAERGGAPNEMVEDNIITGLDDAGYIGTLATNSELDFERYLHPGDQLEAETILETISDKKTTSLATGYFVTWVTTFRVKGEVVGRQLFRVFKFDPNTLGGVG